MNIKAKKQKDIYIETYINEQKLTDSSWNVFVDKTNNDDMHIIIKDEKSNNTVRIIINKTTDFKEIKK